MMNSTKTIDYVLDSLHYEEDFHFLRFEFLQRTNIVSLERKLAEMKTKFYLSKTPLDEDLDKLQITLQQYGTYLNCPGADDAKRGWVEHDSHSNPATAIRNYQYLKGKMGLDKDEARDRKLRLHEHFFSSADVIDPWDSHYSYCEDIERRDAEIDPLRQALIRYLSSPLTYSRHERQERAKEFSDGLLAREVSEFVDRLARFIIAITGGLFLVVPMIIMTLRPSETKSLVTVSVGVVIFALILAFGIRVSNVETLVSTATYAAVLVVFVGTSSGASG